ncbi:MAG: DNA methylase, partial [Gemmataceae bacterium]
KGPRPARSGKKLRWVDSYGNEHDLDYVLERGGTEDKIGTPVAFIESAWRRYTKHSKNKAQEIQGAVLPIADKHRFSAPLLACILAGDYTSNALNQLKSIGFRVLYLSYSSVVEAFATVQIDARFNESTLDTDHEAKMRKWAKVPKSKQNGVWAKLMELNKHNIEEFMAHLERAVVRCINSVRIIPLHGLARDCISVSEAINFVEEYDEAAPTGPLLKYEIVIKYDNGDKIEGQFQDRGTTIEFLAAYKTGNWTPSTEDWADDVE